MKIIMLGSAGFIGTNLVIKLLEEQKNIVTVVDRNPDNLSFLKSLKKCNLNLVELSLSPEYKYNELDDSYLNFNSNTYFIPITYSELKLIKSSFIVNL